MNNQIQKITCLLFILILAINSTTIAQKETNNWLFGSAWLDFSNGAPISRLGSSMNAHEGTSSISHPVSGNLLFYTNGSTVWDKNHNVMANGSGLFGSFSTSQAALIVPQPCTEDIYYLFTLDGSTSLFPNDSVFAYSIVDMSANNGLGAVTVKNQILFSPTNEKITGTFHSNGVDIWIVGQKYTTNVFYAYLLSSRGISGPVISQTGIKKLPWGAGQLKASPNGTKLANVHLAYDDNAPDYPGAIQLMDFDNSSGIVSNGIIIGESQVNSYSVAFSPDSKKIYFSTSMISFKLWQCDISSGNITTINNSITEISDQWFWSMQLAADGKIYLCNKNGQTNSISIINNPNLPGSQCDLQLYAIPLESPSLSGLALPNFVQNFTDPNFIRPAIFDPFADFEFVTPACKDEEINFTGNSSHAFSLFWNFGDPNGHANLSSDIHPGHIYSNPGTYDVQLIARGACKDDTLVKEIEIASPPNLDLGKDTALCNFNDFQIHLGDNTASYIWHDGSSNSFFDVKKPGVISVAASNLCGDDFDELTVSVIDCECDILAQNVFSPNADGINDLFKIEIDCPLYSFNLSIYDRWGNLLHSTSDIANHWNGKVRSKDCPEGVYFYILRFTAKNKTASQNGSITLLR